MKTAEKRASSGNIAERQLSFSFLGTRLCFLIGLNVNGGRKDLKKAALQDRRKGGRTG